MAPNPRSIPARARCFATMTRPEVSGNDDVSGRRVIELAVQRRHLAVEVEQQRPHPGRDRK